MAEGDGIVPSHGAMTKCIPSANADHVTCFHHFPAGTLRYIYIVFMFGGYVEITFDFMLECLVFLT